MSALHRVIGFAVVGTFALGWILGLVVWISRRGAGDWFWRWLVAAQILALVQAIVGVVLLLLGREPSDWLHLVYGIGPLLILGIGHLLAREEQFRDRAWVPFAFASFICFGLSLRALMTGLGLG
jgi:hypothetical protein